MTRRLAGEVMQTVGWQVIGLGLVWATLATLEALERRLTRGVGLPTPVPAPETAEASS